MSQNKYNTLTEDEKNVILHKGTEMPNTGKYNNHSATGVYTCKQCNTPLYNSSHKFESSCGWPSFDDEIAGAVKKVLDADGRRTEIVCNTCNGHLGHVFVGEGLTDKNTRHCVNSISLNFNPGTGNPTIETAIFAGGCFWGVEHLIQQLDGVESAVSGYIGGHTDNPHYTEVCSGTSGHAEAVKIIFDPSIIDYETLTKYFFEIHDPTQYNKQGPDFGTQYRSEVYYTNEEQKVITEKLIEELKANGYKVVTKVTKATTFFDAEDYHQDYYENKGTLPYCHAYTKRFK
jgi:peptide methionine sulfoxide reductase msrA/msrB